ncbi:MAG: PorV/PorQ family protein [Ignavibacteriaceae bacterium]|nr:PorV/PorQ family protein [Ignavibacteriaceae bacterium]
MRNLLLIFLISSVIAYAGDPSRNGTTGADQLLIPVGAQGIATGGAFLSNVTGLEAIYYNPAGLSLSRGSEAMFSYMSYLADINISYFAIGTNLGDLGSFAFSVKTFDFGDIPVTTFEMPDGNGSMYSPSYITAGITYAKVITDRVAVGINAKVISESIESVNATGMALDFGVQYRFPSNLSIGAAVKNIGSNMRYTGTDLQFKSSIPGTLPGSKDGTVEPVTEEFQIPSYFELSTAYSYDINEQNNVMIGATFRNNNSFEDQVKFGFEYGFNNIIFARAGYDLLVENTNESLYGLTLGAGVNYQIAGSIGITFDYAFRQVKDFPSPNHIVTVKLGFE